MDLEYDRKFEEMKKYIPFLESMIKRLESSNSGGDNPRQAQLDKLRSLRCLLIDKKKRMKMENLLKCEQVLVNLYAKVEQRDSLADKKELGIPTQKEKEKNDLSVVRNKLKSVALNIQEDMPDTLPEIARPTNTEVDCTPGSKEPALFQRRPNKVHVPLNESQSRRSDGELSMSTRYTRILMSPERKKCDWPEKTDVDTAKSLPSRKSSRSPRRHSPSYKRERKKLNKQRSKSTQDTKDLNITIKVAEESLNSLDTTDILSRIINCNDNDVDINTLRGLRSQILGELKQTGAKDDISDLILKSYKKKGKESKTKSDEVEEGELSDSESETIENIYGSIVVVNKDEGVPSTSKTNQDKQQSRKIQICLVINSDKENENKLEDPKLNTNVDLAEFESYKEEDTEKSDVVSSETVIEKSVQGRSKKEKDDREKNKITESKNKSTFKIGEENCNVTENNKNEISNEKSHINEIIEVASGNSTSDKTEICKSVENIIENFASKSVNEKIDNVNTFVTNKIDSDENNKSDTDNKGNIKNIIDNIGTIENDISKEKKHSVITEKLHELPNESFKLNFYQPLIEEKLTEPPFIGEIIDKDELKIKESVCQSNIVNITNDNLKSHVENVSNIDGKSSVKDKIKKVVVSEIDILQALKKEILSETVIVPISEAGTPLLHQPKLIKVANSQEVSSKKRISIEKYKQKSVPIVKQPLFNAEQRRTSKDDNSKKQSLKLTEKECERFNFPATLNPDDSSDDDASNISTDEIYGNLAPKSPDHEDFADTGIKPPVIIPIDPVKNVVVSSKLDIDMRPLIGSPVNFCGSNKGIVSPCNTSNNNVHDLPRHGKVDKNENIRMSLSDMRTRTESNQATLRENSNPYLMKSDQTSRLEEIYPSPSDMGPNMCSNIRPALLNVPPGIAPSLSPNLGTCINSIMTAIINPNRPALLSTPQTLNTSLAPIIPSMNPNMTPSRNPNMTPSRNPNMTSSRNLGSVPSLNQAMNPIMTPNSRTYEMTPRPNYDNDDFSNQKHVYAPTYSTFDPHDYMEQENYNNQGTHWENKEGYRDKDYQRHRNDRYNFHRLGSPQIRMECPSTPTPSFGRIESPMTPVHPFGRSDCPMTPSHPFGRSEPNSTPTNVFGRSDYHHNMSVSSHKYNKSQDPRLIRNSDYDSYRGRREDRNRSYYKDNYASDDNSKYMRGQNKYYETGARHEREHRSLRETSVGRSLSRDYDVDESYNKDYYKNDYRFSGKKLKDCDDFDRKRNYRARSISQNNRSEDNCSSPRESETKPVRRENSIEKPISVQSHTGRSFNIDTSFNRTFQETKSSSRNTSFDARKQRANSVGRSLRDYSCEDAKDNHAKDKKFTSKTSRPSAAVNFRRACSVGRDLNDYNSDKNLKEIKADLRSYKFDNKIGERIKTGKTHVGNSNVVAASKDTKRSQLTPEKTSDNKYSPRKNFRDPRLRRETEDGYKKKDKYKDMDRNTGKSRYKNYGIVYSNDNIAKGTILTPTAGVRNFKIPKIKRPEEKEPENNSKTCEEIDKKKEILPKNKKSAEHVKTSQANNIIENKDINSVTSVVDKHPKIDNIKEHSTIMVQNEDTHKTSTVSSISIEDKDSQDEDTNITDIIPVDFERRITRSVKKSLIQSRQQAKISPVKRRRIKKLLIRDSDSDTDSQSSKIIIDHNRYSLEESQKSPCSEVKETCKKVEVCENIEINKQSNATFRNFSQRDSEINTLEMDKNTVAQTENQAKEVKTKNGDNEKSNNYGSNLNDTNVATDYIEAKSAPSISKELSEEQSFSLDMSFSTDDDFTVKDGMDDVASGSVLDNINALIADLDNDIDSPKINDINDKFIKNIMGSISSNDSPIPIEVNERDFAPDNLTNEKLEINEKEGIVKSDKVSQIFDENIKDIVEVADNKNTTANINDKTNLQNTSNVQAVTETKTSVFTTSNMSHKDITSEFNEILNDAIVSTTANDGKVEDVIQDSKSVLSNTDKVGDNCFVPDSTINLNETNNEAVKNVHEAIPDSTNEIRSEMNSDITSTLNTFDVMSKDQSGDTPSSSDKTTPIDSIGKLLSILEDRHKIKELLSILSKDSSDNERIMKKLEKLSEIVSDDDENVSKDEKSKITQNNDCSVNEDQKNKNTSECTSLCSNDNVNSEVERRDNEKSLKKSDLKTVQKGIYSEPLSIDKSVNSQINKEDNKDQEHIPEKEVIVNKNIIEEASLEKNLETVKQDIAGNINVNSEAETHEKVNEEVEPIVSIDKLAEAINVDEKGNKIINSSETEVLPEKNIKKSKIPKKGKAKLTKKILQKKVKRVTRSDAVNSQTQISSAPKKPSRELLKLQEDIREMFISEDILNSTGIRMCRLAKMVEEKIPKGDSPTNDVEPIVVLEKIKGKVDDVLNTAEKTKNKKGIKIKPVHSETPLESKSKEKTNCKPGPKSKTKSQENDCYDFENESLSESNNTVDSRNQNTESESDSNSTKSFASSELLVDLKRKTKRKRRTWKLGVIKSKNSKKKKSDVKNSETPLLSELPSKTDTKDTNEGTKILTKSLPNLNCFTDKTYCFYKNVHIYSCHLCGYRGNDIVPHFKKEHPHSEIPLSRLNPLTAKEAIEQCDDMNSQALYKIKTNKYICRFCFKEFRRSHTALESFFWHVVSVHTGEYKHLCSECINVTRCPFNLDIPPPPKNPVGQLIGYICGRCNFTQVSLENLKTHVIVRHDDEQTEVYSINLADISKKLLQSLMIKANENQTEEPRVLRSSGCTNSMTEPSDEQSDVTETTENIGVDILREVQDVDSNASANVTPKKKIQTKFSFENDNLSDTSNYSKSDEVIKAGIKLERDEDIQDSVLENVPKETSVVKNVPEVVMDKPEEADNQPATSSDVLDYPHFKIKLSINGTKEYICCINGEDSHYKSALLISLKKHVQLKHSENWDGYCFVCKVIVTSQGTYKFKDCLQHYLEKHMDNFPTLAETSDTSEIETSTPLKDAPKPKPYINVRPLCELISSSDQSARQEVNASMPTIKDVVSLVTGDPVSSPPEKYEEYKYEEAQAEIMSKKHRVVLDTMLSSEKLIQVFKCAGRFCSYTTDNAEEALVHASTHQKIGGENSLKCAYCDFDPLGNAIDLVMHVFKNYIHCSYACSKCFYRASASQLVHAHIRRVHTLFDADKVPVLSTATVAKSNSKDETLSREEAVKHYVCNNRVSEENGVCQFKSFILTKFREHLQQRHADDTEYSCYICHISMPSSKLLAQHLKEHGLRIYQCCRCLFGADNETDLITHASAKHPLKQPKAYIRIMTKGNGSEVRVLPLAVLSKTTVQTTVVTPSVDKENPVKQAERSIDLENLIGHTNLMIDSISTVTNPNDVVPAQLVSESQIEQESTQTLSPPSNTNVELSSTNTSETAGQELASSQTMPVIKQEPIEKPAEISDSIPDSVSIVPSVEVLSDPDVVCLDSDEDNSRQNVIDLSNEDVFSLSAENIEQLKTDPPVKLPRKLLYKCQKCLSLHKSEATLKKHFIACFPEVDERIQCAHCAFSDSWPNIVSHYHTHLEEAARYLCTLCNGTFANVATAKRHMRYVHHETNTVTSCKVSPCGSIQYFTITPNVDSKEAQKERVVPKRKMSEIPEVRASEPLPKIKKYGPQDVDRLPINPILDELVYCSLCEFSTKVRLNMVRHLQLHAEQQPVPRTAPVNPVPHLDNNEKHFDKMLNLASSSIALRAEKAKDIATVTEHLSPEAASLYPKYVPARHRYTCGAKDCSYISVNESMFKFHWETLHNATNDYHCVHCPPHQHLDTSKPLTAVRIIAHFKVHGMNLYGCSSCNFYHFTKKLVEKHLRDVHTGRVVVVREEGVAAAPPPAPAPAPPSQSAPTMDLKPWQCGLCKFKSMLRPEVIEHCGKMHQSKMQFKCSYCGFRTSNIENISKHQAKQHPGKKEEVFYFYYREGSIPDEADGSARWQKQSQRSDPDIKTESDPVPGADLPATPAPANPPVNLDIVKKEVVEPEKPAEETIEDLCKEFGQFCDPNGLKYKCSLCKIVIVDNVEDMQSHLYEELQYRKWRCGVCSYKAFHKPGLQQHFKTEHMSARDLREPIELQVDPRIETWVSTLLQHQTSIIERNKENLAKQKEEILRSTPGTVTKIAPKPMESKAVGDKSNVSMAELERLFGQFGAPSNMNYSCPKCSVSARVESVMREHLEMELNKIRWCCNVCTETFQSYHDAQFHCRSVHPGQSSRPVEAVRDPVLRAAWVDAVLRVQKLSMNYMPVTDPTAPVPPQLDTSDNSLLVVRYEEKIATPEEQMRPSRQSLSDDDKLVIDEPEAKSKDELVCPWCASKFRYERFRDIHILKHYGLKPFTCPYCPYGDFRKGLECHLKMSHPGKDIVIRPTPIPTTPLAVDHLKSTSKGGKSDEEVEYICLTCEKVVAKNDKETHTHPNSKSWFAKKGEMVFKCCICLTLHKTANSLKSHHNLSHMASQPNYAYYKLHNGNLVTHCTVCQEKFSFLVELKAHCEAKHGLMSVNTEPNAVIEIYDDDVVGDKRKPDDDAFMPVPKRVARKSTTKLPFAMAVARKSTTKLPYSHCSELDEYSYYGMRSSMENLENVTTLMPFCNTMVPFSLKKLGEIIKIYPSVLVEDINKK